MKKMKLAAIFAGLVSVFTFSSCLNDGADRQRGEIDTATGRGTELIFVLVFPIIILFE